MDKLVSELVKGMISSPLYWFIVILGIAAYIINKKIEVKRAIDSYKCPRCGGILVKRNGKFGEFIGCSNFPKCRFTIRK